MVGIVTHPIVNGVVPFIVVAITAATDVLLEVASTNWKAVAMSRIVMEIRS